MAKFLLKFIQTEEYSKMDLNLNSPKIHNLFGKSLVKMFPFETCWARYLSTVFKWVLTEKTAEFAFCAVCREPPFLGEASNKTVIALEVHGGE